MSRYNHGRSTVHNINYHIVWSVKYRRKVLTPEITTRLYEILKQQSDQSEFSVVTCKVGNRDHVHCFVTTSPKVAVAQIVKTIKGCSSRYLFAEFPEQKTTLRKGHLWNPSYFVETIGSTSESDIQRYIFEQRNY